eukprot:7293739-Lingulodinium_polyedra.AAC.1
MSANVLVPVQFATLYMNMPYGFWEGQKFLHELAEASHQHLSTLSEDDILVIFFGEDIVVEQGITGPA